MDELYTFDPMYQRLLGVDLRGAAEWYSTVRQSGTQTCGRVVV